MANNYMLTNMLVNSMLKPVDIVTSWAVTINDKKLKVLKFSECGKMCDFAKLSFIHHLHKPV